MNQAAIALFLASFAALVVFRLLKRRERYLYAPDDFINELRWLEEGNPFQVENSQRGATSNEELSPESIEQKVRDQIERGVRGDGAVLASRSRNVSPARVRLRMQVVISVTVLFAALLIIFLPERNAEAQKWAFGTVGLVLGFWLK